MSIISFLGPYNVAVSDRKLVTFCRNLKTARSLGMKTIRSCAYFHFIYHLCLRPRRFSCAHWRHKTSRVGTGESSRHAPFGRRQKDLEAITLTALAGFGRCAAPQPPHTRNSHSLELYHQWESETITYIIPWIRNYPTPI